MLADRLTPREFSELTDVDYELSQLLYVAYAAEDEAYGQIVGDISDYGPRRGGGACGCENDFRHGAGGRRRT